MSIRNGENNNMRLIDADELLKDLYDWKEEVKNNPYISCYERVPKLDTIEHAIEYVKEQPEVITMHNRRKYSYDETRTD